MSVVRDDQPDAREGEAGRSWGGGEVRSTVKPGNAGRGRDPSSRQTQDVVTRICKAPEGEFDFLGYTFGRMYSAKTGKARLG